MRMLSEETRQNAGGRKSRHRPEFAGEDCWEQWEEACLESASELELCVTVKDAWGGGGDNCSKQSLMVRASRGLRV